MSEFLHHLLGAAWNFLILAGVLTVAFRAWLDHRLDRLEHPADFDAPDVVASLILPAFLPLAWLASSIVHLMEPGRVVDHCCTILTNPSASEAVFGTGIVMLLGVQLLSLRRKWHRSHSPHGAAHGTERRRVQRICGEHPRLARATVRVVDCGRRTCLTRGLFRPWIEISAELSRQFDDDALQAALLHEAGHAATLDPLRSAIVLFAQILNPFGALLSRHVEAWRFGTEVARDFDAIRDGAQPLAMADALVTAAHCQVEVSVARCHLHGGREALEARVHLLLSGDAVSPRRRTGDFRWLTAALAVGLTLPHLLGARLFALHCLLERLLS